MINLLGYVATAITLFSVWVLASRSLSYWFLSGINQCLWCYIGIATKQYYIVLLAVCLQILNIRGYLKWRKDGSR